MSSAVTVDLLLSEIQNNLNDFGSEFQNHLIVLIGIKDNYKHDSLARKPQHTSVTSHQCMVSLWKCAWPKCAFLEVEPSHHTKWTVVPTLRRDHQAGVWLSVECLCVPQTHTQLNSACLLFMNTGEQIHLNNVKGHFRISMVEEMYCQNPVFTN